MHALRQFARAGQAVGLHHRHRHAQHARRFQRVRREHAWGAPLRQARLQVGAGADQVQRVGVQHQRAVAVERLGHQPHRIDRVAHARPEHQRAAKQIQVVGRAEHDFGLAAVVAGRRVQRRDIHAPRAGIQRAARGQHRCTGHAVRATDHGDVAEAALVRVLAARREAVRKCRQPVHGCRRGCGRRIHAERVHAHHTCVIAPVGSVQARLVGDERDRVRGAHRDTVRADDGARVGVQATRHVQRQDWTVHGIQARDDIAVLAGERAGQADAEQAVDDERPLAIGRQHVEPANGAGTRALVGGGGFARGVVVAVARQVQHGRVDAGFGQVGRHLECIAAIVAGAGQYQHRRATQVVRRCTR